MLLFNSIIQEAKLSSVDRSKRYYHGCDNEASAQNILKVGLLPDTKPKKGWATPVKGRVYLTPDLSYALIYALGGAIVGEELFLLQIFMDQIQIIQILM